MAHLKLICIFYIFLTYEKHATGHRMTQGIAYFGGVDEYGSSPDLYAQIINPIFNNTLDFEVEPDEQPLAQASASSFDDGWTNKLYICGGRKSTGAISNVCFSIETALDEVKVNVAPSLRQARTYHASSLVNQNIYVCGGLGKVGKRETALATCEKLDVNQCHKRNCNTNNVHWLPSPSMQISRYGHVTLAVSNTEFCAFGGRQGVVSSVSSAIIVAPTLLNSVECYDISTGKWSSKAPMPQKRTGHAAVLLNGQSYICGGTLDADTATDTCVVYNPITDVWSGAGKMAVARVDHAMVVYRGQIYILGGIGSDYTCTDSMEAYDWSTGKSNVLPHKLKGARSSLVAVAILF